MRVVFRLALFSLLASQAAFADPTFERIRSWAEFQPHQFVESVHTNSAGETTVSLSVLKLKVELADVFAISGCEGEKVGTGLANVLPICAGLPAAIELVPRPRVHSLSKEEACKLETLLDLYRPHLVALRNAKAKGIEPSVNPVQCRFESSRSINPPGF